MELVEGKRTGNRSLMEAAWERWRRYYGGKVLCCNCGEKTGAEATEMDHSVPLYAGGYDTITNMVPLCHVCHAKKTVADKNQEEISRRIKEGQARSDKKCGRPRSNLPENYKDLLDDFVHCRISRERLAKKINLAVPIRNGNGKTKISDLVHLSEQIWYREYLDDLGIEKVVNKVGHPTRDFYNKGIVGYIVYKTGRKEYIYNQPETKAE